MKRVILVLLLLLAAPMATAQVYPDVLAGPKLGDSLRVMASMTEMRNIYWGMPPIDENKSGWVARATILSSDANGFANLINFRFLTTFYSGEGVPLFETLWLNTERVLTWNEGCSCYYREIVDIGTGLIHFESFSYTPPWFDGQNPIGHGLLVTGCLTGEAQGAPPWLIEYSESDQCFWTEYSLRSPPSLLRSSRGPLRMSPIK